MLFFSLPSMFNTELIIIYSDSIRGVSQDSYINSIRFCNYTNEYNYSSPIRYIQQMNVFNTCQDDYNCNIYIP